MSQIFHLENARKGGGNAEKLRKEFVGWVLAFTLSVGLDPLDAQPLVWDSPAARSSRQSWWWRPGSGGGDRTLYSSRDREGCSAGRMPAHTF